MTQKYFFGSLTRITDLEHDSFEVMPQDRALWGVGDLVVGEVRSAHTPLAMVELTNGRMASICGGDLVVGAFGERRATLEAVGSWEEIGPDLRMHAMTAAGLIGKVTSRSYFMSTPLALRYLGHVTRRDRTLRLQDFARIVEPVPYATPTILIIGTSMSSGKTTSARLIVRLLKEAGLSVVGAKLTGAARFRDVLAMRDAGADHIFDFVDAGLTSSIGPADEFRAAVATLLSMIQRERPDVAVIEAGASPFEPYNGQVAMDALESNLCFTLLCASDPYAVVGVIEGFGFRPDLVAGLATATSAGVDLVGKLAGVPAMDLLDQRSWPEFRALLHKRLALFQERAKLA